MFSSMLYQCWMSSATDFIHHVMNFSVLKSFNFSSSVCLERTLVIFYQVSPCIDKGVKGIDLFPGEPLPWMMLQACLGEIAVQADATFLGKCFELRPDFIRTSEGMYSGRRFLCYVLFLHCQYLLMKGMNIKLLERRTRSASLRVARETFRSATTGTPVLYYKRISRKVPLKKRVF